MIGDPPQSATPTPKTDSYHTSPAVAKLPYGKMVLFRTEDLLQNSTNINLLDIQAPYTTAPLGQKVEASYATTAIARSMAFNHIIVKGSLENNTWEHSTVTSIGTIKGTNNVRFRGYAQSFQDVSLEFLPEGIFGASTEITAEEYNPGSLTAGSTKMGLEPGYMFRNHNISVSRPLTTPAVDYEGKGGQLGGYGSPAVGLINPHGVSPLSQYGIDAAIEIKPVYNFYLKEYEQYYSDLPKRDSGRGRWLATEKAIPNFYYTLLATHYLTDATAIYKNKPKTGYEPIFKLSPAGFLKTVAFLNKHADNPSGEALKSAQPANAALRIASNYNSAKWVYWQGLRDELFNSELNRDRERNSVVVVTSDFYDLFAESIEAQKKLYPYYNEISIPTIKNGTVFGDLLRQANLYDEFQYYLASSLKGIHNSLESQVDPEAPPVPTGKWIPCKDAAKAAEEGNLNNPFSEDKDGGCWTYTGWLNAKTKYNSWKAQGMPGPSPGFPPHPQNNPDLAPPNPEPGNTAWTPEPFKSFEPAEAFWVGDEKDTLLTRNLCRYDGYRFTADVQNAPSQGSNGPGPLETKWVKIMHEAEVTDSFEPLNIHPYHEKSVEVLEFNFCPGVFQVTADNANISAPPSFKDLGQAPDGKDGFLQSSYVLANSKNYIDLPYMSPRKQLQDCKSVLEHGKFWPIGKNARFTNYGEFADTYLDKTTCPLVFFGNKPEKTNAGNSVIVNKAAKILSLIANKAHLLPGAVFKNKFNYSEILFFEVVKYKIPGNAYKRVKYMSDTSLEFPGQIGLSGEELSKFGIGTWAEPVQTFIIPNDPKYKNIKYIDSQVLYGEGYIYQIFAHTVSVGNQLRRASAIANEPADCPTLIDSAKEAIKAGADAKSVSKYVATWSYENDLDVRILRVPYYNVVGVDTPVNEGTWNVDSPPLSPEISLFPFKNVANKLGFWFNLQVGSIVAPRITALETAADKERLDYVMSYQTAGGIVGPGLLYKTDDYGGTVEVYRLSHRPDSLLDFVDNKIADVDIIGNKTLIDDIEPNQDYYYTFRMKDNHGLCSNPSPVYHIKMITHNDFPEQSSTRVGVDSLQPVLFSEIVYPGSLKINTKKSEKSFKKYLLVEPTLSQAFLSFENFENDSLENGILVAGDIKQHPENLRFGGAIQEGHQVYGKKFKIRLTSKQTGRKLDVNVKFENIDIKEDYNK